MNRPEKAWKKYRLEVYETDKPLQDINQERECSMSFYAGMLVAFNIFTQISSTFEEGEGILELEKLLGEIETAGLRTNLDRATGKS